MAFSRATGDSGGLVAFPRLPLRVAVGNTEAHVVEHEHVADHGILHSEAVELVAGLLD